MLRCKLIIIIHLLLLTFSGNLYSQIEDEEKTYKSTNLSGPRIGLTYILGEGESYQTLKSNNMDRLISQFGWHFEYQVSPKSIPGPSFVDLVWLAEPCMLRLILEPNGHAGFYGLIDSTYQFQRFPPL